MALKIRLSRGGAKKDAHYKIVVIESTKSRDGEAVEVVGHYHPRVKDEEKRVVVDADKLNKWISNGARPTEVVVRLLLAKGFSELQKFVIKRTQGKNFGKSKKEIKEAKA